MQEQVHDIGRRRAWVIWLAALSVYVLAVFHRSSLGWRAYGRLGSAAARDAGACSCDARKEEVTAAAN